jgi:hypothetical protein
VVEKEVEDDVQEDPCDLEKDGDTEKRLNGELDLARVKELRVERVSRGKGGNGSRRPTPSARLTRKSCTGTPASSTLSGWRLFSREGVMIETASRFCVMVHLMMSHTSRLRMRR